MKHTETQKKGSMLRVLSLIAMLAIFGGAAFAGSHIFSTNGSTGRKVFLKTTTTQDSLTVPNHVVEPSPMVAADLHAPAANTAAVVTYAADTDEKHVIHGVAWSYSGGPTNGNLKIEDVSGTTIFTMDITAAGPGSIIFPRPIRGAAINTAMIVTLAAGGSGISGKVNVLGHTKE